MTSAFAVRASRAALFALLIPIAAACAKTDSSGGSIVARAAFAGSGSLSEATATLYASVSGDVPLSDPWSSIASGACGDEPSVSGAYLFTNEDVGSAIHLRHLSLSVTMSRTSSGGLTTYESGILDGSSLPAGEDYDVLLDDPSTSGTDVWSDALTLPPEPAVPFAVTSSGEWIVPVAGTSLELTVAGASDVYLVFDPGSGTRRVCRAHSSALQLAAEEVARLGTGGSVTLEAVHQQVRSLAGRDVDVLGESSRTAAFRVQ